MVRGQHRYSEYRVFDKFKIVLCDFCDVDFGSYHPDYFGLPHTGEVLGIDCLRFSKEISDPSQGIDLICPECDHRLSFIKFRMAAIEYHQGPTGRFSPGRPTAGR